MVVWQRITLIGSSHISKDSLRDAEQAIREVTPHIVALELDKGRFVSLMHPETQRKLPSLRLIGLKGYVFARIGQYAQKKLGDVVGVSPGSEMKHAALVAHELGLRIALIDRPIQHTLKRLSSSLTWKEKWHFLVDSVKGLFGKGTVSFDIRSVPSEQVIEELMVTIKDRYPTVYRVLVTERNSFMAQRLYTLNKDYSVVAVVGAGHLSGLVEELERLSRESVK